jgi:translation initiation factor IF-2
MADKQEHGLQRKSSLDLLREERQAREAAQAAQPSVGPGSVVTGIPIIPVALPPILFATGPNPSSQPAMPWGPTGHPVSRPQAQAQAQAQAQDPPSSAMAHPGPGSQPARGWGAGGKPASGAHASPSSIMPQLHPGARPAQNPSSATMAQVSPGARPGFGGASAARASVPMGVASRANPGTTGFQAAPPSNLAQLRPAGQPSRLLLPTSQLAMDTGTVGQVGRGRGTAAQEPRPLGLSFPQIPRAPPSGAGAQAARSSARQGRSTSWKSGGSDGGKNPSSSSSLEEEADIDAYWRVRKGKRSRQYADPSDTSTESRGPAHNTRQRGQQKGAKTSKSESGGGGGGGGGRDGGDGGRGGGGGGGGAGPRGGPGAGGGSGAGAGAAAGGGGARR